MSLFKRHAHTEELDNTDDEHDDTIDPQLRLRTVRTAASTIAESIRSEQRAERRRSRQAMRKKRSFFRGKARDGKKSATAQDGTGTGAETVSVISRASTTKTTAAAAEIPGQRRNIYVNMPLTASELDNENQPLARYPRNKVRTTKYTIITFLPKNLYEQFGRVANIYFLALDIFQVFSIFGATTPQIAMLPLVFILCVTAVKDGIEDYRRAVLDEEVNTSATTKLGQWRNMNIPADPRPWFERLLGLNPPGKVTKGVRRLREKEAGEGMRVVLRKDSDVDGDKSSISTRGMNSNSLDIRYGHGDHRLEDIQSVDSHSYPPNAQSDTSLDSRSFSFDGDRSQPPNILTQLGSLANNSAYRQSVRSHNDAGVIDWRKRALGSASWERTLWKKLEVGDVVLLRDNDQIPADIAVLSTSDPNALCYVETKNLDGETNLKPRKAIRGTSSIVSEEDIERSSFVLDSEPPHQNLYLYNGVLRYTDPASGEQRQESVTINELLLRGCTVRNTSWIIGLVVFTGSDTKIMLNGGETPSKRSKIDKETNFNVIVNFVILILMCTVAAIVNGISDNDTKTSRDFYEIDSNPSSSSVVNALVTFVSCLIVFQNIVPISLYISIEIVKTIQAYFISQDVDMYYEAYDAPCISKTWSISDDLGQIEYIFSDKTGTLTQNIMEFQRCSVHGVAYGEGVTEAQRGAATREGRADTMSPEELAAKLAALKKEMVTKLERAFKNRYMQKDKLTFVSPKFADDVTDRSSEQRKHIAAFFRALALCHGVLAEKPDTDKRPFHLEYKAESPDEAALVAAARDVGFPFVGKTKDTLDIEVMGQMEKYTLLKVLEFNSTRKRMSVIVRTPEGKLVLYCKGADSVIYERLAADHDLELKERTARDMEVFANSGLRTLCIAYRNMTEEEYLSWSRTYDSATSTIKNRDEEIIKAEALIEHSLTILGATALEDKLQEGVPEAIELLHKAGIKLWILTGDKLQTAIEIGFSCNLLKSDMEIMILSAATPEEARAQIEAGLNKIASILGPPSLDPHKRGFVPGAQAAFAVVIDGDTLRYALEPGLKSLFLSLGTQCETVVCCRVSPAQKALTVKLVKEGRNAMTLSIGDGANDVAMIQEANIGCGLLGLEGSQAAMSADYAFGQFRYLTKLLLVHGRWSYQRIADMHSNFFYKNIIWTFSIFWFLPFNNFDATYLYQYTFILLFNIVFTSLPVIVLGAFDQDINARAALAFPQLYVRGIRGLEYTRTKFWLYMLDGLYQSCVVYFIAYAVWTLEIVVSWNGRGIESLSDFGTTISVSAIIAANTYVGMNTHYWTVITWLTVLGSSLAMILWIVIYSFFQSPDFIDEVTILFGELTFWTTVVISVVLSLTPRYLVKFVTTAYRPLDKDIVREMWVLGDLKDRLGIRHRSEAKNKRSLTGTDIEYAPMFREPHARSQSDASMLNGGTGSKDDSEPAFVSNAGEFLATATPPNTTPLGTPMASPRGKGSRLSYYSEASSPRALAHEQTATTATHLTPEAAAGTHTLMAPSPTSLGRPDSYYSASDIPTPSPIPPALYRLQSGEFTYDPPDSSSHNRKPSISRSVWESSAAPGTGAGGTGGGSSGPDLSLSSVSSPAQIPPSSPPRGISPYLASITGSSSSSRAPEVSPGSYEMTVRQPEQYSSAPHSPAPATAAAATAIDGENGGSNDGRDLRSPSPDRTELPRGPSVMSGTTRESYATARESAAGTHYDSESEYDDDDRTEQDHYHGMAYTAEGQQQQQQQQPYQHRHRPSDASTIRGATIETSQQQHQAGGGFIDHHKGSGDDGAETWEGAVAI